VRWLFTSLIVLSLILAVSTLFNLRRRHLQYLRYPQIGRSIDIGGRTLNISCLGNGTPAVIFETVSHQAGFSWSAAQPHVAKFTRAVLV
jgi:hypothetical protein